MKALVIAHDHLSSPGLLTTGLTDAGFELIIRLVVPAERFHTPDVASDLPDLAGFDLIVALGAPWSVYDVDQIGSWVLDELEYLRAADTAGIPVLGVCFGGQMLATVHGGSVAKSAWPEIGWYDVAGDGSGTVEDAPWCQWHSDAWTVPPGAQEIARNDNASQAFRLRRNLAVQFHPELNSSILAGWLANGGDSSARAHGIDPDELIARTAAEEDEAGERATRLVRRFLDDVAFSAVS
ncbi:MAG TPA: aminotransferase [Jatrophihabitans sp.]|nr:aminotransferase [Jatrophihabitans sp.]